MKTRMFNFMMMVVLGAIFPGIAAAQSVNPSLDQPFTFRLGPFLANLDATLKVRGEDISIDENLDTSDIDFSLYGLWRITPRWRVEAGYSGINKSARNTLDSNVNFGSVTVPAGLSLNNTFETTVLRVAAGYAFMRSETYEVGVDLGVNFTSLKESFQASLPGGQAIKVSPLDVDEPLPTLGLFFNYAFSSDWYLTTRAGLFAFDIGDIDGTIFDVFGGVEYRPWENIGFGLAYTYTSADLTISGSTEVSDIEYDYNGPLFYAVFGF